MENRILNISHRLLLLNPHSASELVIFHFTGDKVEAVKHLVMCPIHKDKGSALLNSNILTQGVESTYHTATYLQLLSHPALFSSSQE